jgi:type II secretory pathway pseudopilin PulG
MKKQKAFTLVEVLIVMGILIILIGAAIMISRSAIRRANKIEHQDAVRNIEAGLIQFKNENKVVPRVGDTCAYCYESEVVAKMLGYSGGNGEIEEFLDESPFQGGSDATYYYATDDIGQFFVVCVSFGGVDDESELGYYCTGTGIGFIPENQPITKNEIEGDDMYHRNIMNDLMDDADWERDEGFINR